MAQTSRSSPAIGGAVPTHSVHSSYIEEATAAGADYCLMKDCSRQDLLRSIVELAGRD